MIMPAEMRDWVKTLGLFDGYWTGRLSTKRDNTLGIYSMKNTAPRRVCLGGVQFNGYDVTAVSFLIHGNNNKNETERLAWDFYNAIADRSEFLIGEKTVYFVRLMQDCPVDVGSDGDVYESHLFTGKDDRFESEFFLREVKEIYTELINRRISNPEQHLKVFDKNSVYLTTKKIGKNNPKAAEVEADNAARQEWNRTADMALVSWIEEAKILEIKQTEIHDKVGSSIRKGGCLPNLFRRIVNKAKDFLQNLIREHGIPSKPTLSIDMTEFRTMRNLMIRVHDEARTIRSLQEKVPKLKEQLSEAKDIFKGKECKALTEQIQQT